jgi:pyruvate dehydrogenase E2 component (dihydrolipoamide acetyltransferase)
MASVLRMPGVSADATEAVLVEWTVKPGAQVKRGDVIASIETDKAVVDLEAEEDAVLLKAFAAAGDTVTVGGPLAVFVQPGEEATGEDSILAELGLGPQGSGPVSQADEEQSQDSLVPDATPEIEHTADQVVNGGSKAGGRIFASPLARRMAAEAGLRIEELEGSGPGGRVRRRDITEALSRPDPAASAGAEPTGTAGQARPATAASPGRAPAPARALAQPAGMGPDAYTDIPHTRFRRAAASALVASKQQVPHFYLKATCRVDRLLELRATANAASGLKITVNDLLVKAAGLAMADVPDMNVIWTPDAVRRFSSADIAVAVASERGLMTPVVRSVQNRSLSDISATIKDFAARAGEGRLKQPELEGGSLAVSNLGMFGVEEFTAIINPPQAGILAIGAVTSLPVESEDGGIGFAKFIKVVLSVDHRPVDGALAARWLGRFKELAESPFRLLL